MRKPIFAGRNGTMEVARMSHAARNRPENCTENQQTPQAHTMTKLIYSLMICSAGLCLRAQSAADSISYLTLNDTVFLSSGIYGELMLSHKMKTKQTLYTLSRFYGLSLEELYLYNPEVREQGVKLGQSIYVPMPNKAIVRYKDANFKDAEHIPVLYTVRPGETLYRISTQIFKISVDEMMARNGLSSPTLRSGQCLHIGWMHVEGVKEETRKVSGSPLAQRNQSLKQRFIHGSGTQKVIERQGVAFWQKNSGKDSDLYALHRDAAINSVIAVTNPMKKQTVYVKVIGRIPETAYGPDVLVVLSPLAAKVLGAIDPRFFVKVQHLVPHSK